jgi:hypothetical protein
MGAHPVTVFRAIWRVGWRCIPPALVIGAFVVVAFGGLAGVLQIEDPATSAFAYWGFWVFVCYGTMVVLRVLGLFYHRHARALGWFRDQPGWGA